MKVLFCTMRYNWHYIFITSNKITASLFSVWGFVTLVTPTDIMLNCIDNVVMRMIVAMFILTVIYFDIVIGVTIYTKQRKQVKIFNLHSNHSLFVEYGDLFNNGNPNEKKNIAFAGNRCFDTIVDDDLIGSKKIHGLALERIYKQDNRDSDTVSNEIQNNLLLHGYKYTNIKQKDKRSGNLRRYDIGSVAEIKGLNNEQYFILGLTYFDNELRAHVEKEDYIKAIASLVKYISERSQGFPTYMPVIGTGGADAGSANDLVVYIVKTIELFKDKIDCDIHIVVSDKEEKIGLMNLKMLQGGTTHEQNRYICCF